MRSNINKSLRRHNKLNHQGANGTLHLGNGVIKPAPNSPKFKAVNDQPEPMRVPVADYCPPLTDEGEQI